MSEGNEKRTSLAVDDAPENTYVSGGLFGDVHHPQLRER